MDDSKKWDKPGFGTLFLFKNRKNDKQPNYTGSFVVERDYRAGEKINFGMWEKETQYGNKFFSLREDNYKPDERTPRPDREVAYKPGPRRNRDDDEIPF